MSAPHSSEFGGQNAFQHAKRVKEIYEAMLLTKANVVGVGVGLLERNGLPQDAVALIVLVNEKVPRGSLAAEDRIPAEIEGVPVDVQEVGTITAS